MALVGHTTHDAPRRDTAYERAAFAKVRNAERSYATKLRQVARAINDIVRGFDLSDAQQITQLQNVLRTYADVIRPWARVTSARMIADVSRRDERAWVQYVQLMGVEMQREMLATAPIGEAMRGFLDTQVELITSLPLQAAERVHEMTIKNRYEGGRFEDLANKILATGEVTKNRATLIARTETARTASGLTMVRAKHIGSEAYIWRTVRDRNVRRSHRHMEGQVVRWDDPPVVDEGVPPYHAGMIWNCRCFPQPIIPETFSDD